jgi:hypothetical protein
LFDFGKKNSVEIALTQNWFLLEIVIEKEKCIMKEAWRKEGGGKREGTQEIFKNPPIYRNISSSLFPNFLTFQHVRDSFSLQTKSLTQI